MDSRRSPEGERLAAEVRRFGRTHLKAAELERLGCVPAPLLGALADLGLFGMTLPPEHGGAGLPLVDACAAIEELAYWDRSVATLVGLHAGLGSRAIVAYARPDVAAEVLPRMATGEWIGAFSATEAGAGSDLMSVRTTARSEGDEFVLDGEKSYVTNGRIAGCYTVLARTNARAHALFLVPSATPGVTVGPEEHKLGLRASSTVSVAFSGARVPASHLLGPVDRGLEGAYRVLTWGRTLMSAGCVGTARAALEATLAHVTGRVQFRRPLAEFAAVKGRVAEMAAMVFAARAVVERAANAVDDDASPELPTLVAKVFASERAFEVCDAAIQLHGALGVLEDVGVARLLRDCRVTRIFEGANDVLLMRLAAARLTGTTKLTPVPCAGPLADLAEPCNALVARFEDACASLRATYGAAFVSRQSMLLHLARAEVAHVAAEAVITSAGPEDTDLARLAAVRLLKDAGAELASLRDAARLDALSATVADALYAARKS